MSEMKASHDKQIGAVAMTTCKGNTRSRRLHSDRLNQNKHTQGVSTSHLVTITRIGTILAGTPSITSSLFSQHQELYVNYTAGVVIVVAQINEMLMSISSRIK